jgi:hypothetical protein
MSEEKKSEKRNYPLSQVFWERGRSEDYVPQY